MHTEILTILDRSGSMNPVADDVIGGFNALLEDQRALEGEARLSLVLFDHEYTERYISKPLEAVAPLSAADYFPRGMTALFDAIGRAVHALTARISQLPEGARPEKVIVAIQTDGMENASKEFTRDQIADLLQERQASGWEVIFLGANIDAFSVGGDLGIPAENITNYDGTAAGTRAAFGLISSSVSAYRQG